MLIGLGHMSVIIVKFNGNEPVEHFFLSMQHMIRRENLFGYLSKFFQISLNLFFLVTFSLKLCFV